MIPFNNLAPLHALLRREIETALRHVLDSGWYILGEQVEAFEADFAEYHGVAHAVGVANGTDALELALRACGVAPGAEVITVAHTAVATVCAIERAGAIPVLVDIDPDTFTLDPSALELAITPRTAAIVPVHLYGQPANLKAIMDIAARRRLLVIEDCAQAHGARYQGQRVGTFGQAAAFSFYPTKNVGAYGDGGAVITNDAGIARRLRLLRNYGQAERGVHETRGINSRLDELQAAILRVKLRYLDEHNEQRRALAARYTAALADLHAIRLPYERRDARHVYHLFVIRSSARDELAAALARRGIGTLVHYPIPVHRQAAYRDLGDRYHLPVTDEIAGEVLSLPLYIGLDEAQIDYIARAVRESATAL